MGEFDSEQIVRYLESALNMAGMEYDRIEIVEGEH